MESRVTRRAVTVTLTLAGVLVAAIVGFFATRSPGYASTSVQAEQRAAWVTSNKDLMLGLLNQQTHEVESPVVLDSQDTELLQNDASVVVVDRVQHTLRTLDPTTAALSGKVTIPESADVAISETTVAVTDLRTGSIWVLPTAGLGTDDLTTEKPNGTAAPGAVATVTGGTVTVAAPGADALTVLTAGGGDAAGQGSDAQGSDVQGTVPLPDGRLTAASEQHPTPVSITAVGAVPVVLDAPANRIIVQTATGPLAFGLPDGTAHPVLQQPGPAADSVLIGTDTALLRVNLATGAVQSQPTTGSGSAAAPVLVAGCAHEAWSGGTPTYLLWCGDTPTVRDISGVVDASRLIFRVNGDTVVLNDVTTGNSWVIDDDMVLVNNWDQIRSDENDVEKSETGVQGQADRLTTARTDCSKGMAPPHPKADSYGVRTGTATVLRVLDNDQSSSCSIAVISQVDGPEGVATVIDGGQALQVAPPLNATGPIQLSYTVDDGAGHDAAAKVTVNPVSQEKPVPPKKVRDSAATVIVGGTITTDVLGDWISPTGDALFLTAATSNNPDDRISYSPDGNITVGDTGTAGLTKKTINFTVSDGTNSVPGRLTVEVVDEAKANPVASPVYVSGVVGEQIEAEPLKSVLWPGSEEVTLTKVAPQKATPGLSVTPDRQAGTVTLVGAKAGSYYLDYEVAAGDKQAKGVLRVDVRDKPVEQLPPVPMTDVAYLPTGGEALVDLTANDTDPAGGIVAVQSIDAAAGDAAGGAAARGLIIQTIDMHLARISARHPLPAAGIWLTYTVSAGGPSAVGWLHVVPVPQPAEPMSPIASPIQVSVRAGDAITIPVAQHAVDPSGDLVRPVAFAKDAIGADQGLLFATGDSVRYMAPASGPVAKGKTLRTQYTVTNQAGKRASANLAITVVPTGDNAPPQAPPTAQARVFAGGTVDIPLPIDGIDPDGDWAIAAAVAEPPNLGSAAVSGTSTIRYSAFDKPGLDTFTYTISDPFGGTATGTVDVLVAPLPKTAEPPVAPDLQAVVAPGKAIAVNVLDEVTDPGGLAVSFADPAFSSAGSRGGLQLSVRDSTIVAKAGASPGTVALQYNVKNARQRTASGTLTIKVDPNAPKVSPTAQDALIVDSMISPDHQSARVDLTAWTANPGGLPEDLKAAVPQVSQGRLTVTGKQTVSVKLAERRQVLAYQVTNADGLSAEAFLIVPSRTELNIAAPPQNGPQQKPETPPDPEPEVYAPKALKPLVVDAGTEVRVKVADYVGGTKDGRKVTLPANGSNKASTGELSRVDADTLLWTVPEDGDGKAQLNVTVTDGVAKPVRTGIQARIRAKKPKAPVFQNTEVQVEPGTSSAPTSLSDLVTYDPDKMSNLKFSLKSSSSNGITARLAGDKFTVSAPASTAKGTQATFKVAVNDGVNPEVVTDMPVQVISSTKPPITLSEQTVEALAGQPKTVNVLDGAGNPFGADQPLKLISVGTGAGYSVDFDGSGSVTVTPDPDYTGQLTVPFVVADASGDPDRNVQSQLTVTVRGKPDAPGVPTKLEVGDGTATVQWTEPADNGSPITGYTVSANGFSQDCAASPCTLKGLTNNSTYSFTVIAHNGAGESPASRGSAGIRPDTSPEPPGPPRLTEGDRTLAASWQPPANNGSPISGYEVQITPAPSGSPGTVKVAAAVHDRDFAHLENGTQYTVKVRALNASGTPSDWSPGTSVVPAGKPGTPTDVRPNAATKAGAAKRIDVSWTEADDGGDPPHYRMTWHGDDGSGDAVDLPVGTTSAHIDPAKLGVTYTVTVVASNKAGSSAASAPASVKPYTAPGQVSDLTATATGNNNEVTLAWSAASSNGYPITTYQYSLGGDAWKDTGSDQPGVKPDGLTNGTAYTFRVRACTAAPDEGANCAEPSNTEDAKPYGPPAAPPNLTADADAAAGQLVLHWDAADGNGRDIKGYQYAIAGSGDWKDTGKGTDTSLTVPGDNGTAYTYVVRAINGESAGNLGDRSNEVTATPYDTPGAPTGLTVDRTGSNNQVKFNWTDGPANGRPISSYDYTTDGGSSWRGITNGGTATVQSDGKTLTNGSTYTFQVRAHTAAPQRNVSAGSNTNTATPYGPVPKPNPSKSGATQDSVSFTWPEPASNGIGGYTYSVNGGGAQAGRSATMGTSCGKSVTISVVAIDSQGHRSEAGTQPGSADACPNPSIQVAAGDGVSTSTCDIRCNYIAFTYSHFSGGDYHAKVYTDGSLFREYDFSLGAGGGKHQFTAYLGDHSIDNKVRVKIVVSGADSASDERDFPNTG
ncbi:fibronectin type III domain-containing protein [Nakamurella lactea]|uniref:fibronectin type III domain-containing protein n=1 Tax=Nakamurella lactea TaxID=459515 RepID=UPI000408278E|nr:fibronectin type III domain-containing protein [Nakamurella lactea]